MYSKKVVLVLFGVISFTATTNAFAFGRSSRSISIDNFIVSEALTLRDTSGKLVRIEPDSLEPNSNLRPLDHGLPTKPSLKIDSVTFTNSGGSGVADFKIGTSTIRLKLKDKVSIDVKGYPIGPDQLSTKAELTGQGIGLTILGKGYRDGEFQPHEVIEACSGQDEIEVCREVIEDHQPRTSPGVRPPHPSSHRVCERITTIWHGERTVLVEGHFSYDEYSANFVSAEGRSMAGFNFTIYDSSSDRSEGPCIRMGGIMPPGGRGRHH